MTNFSHDRRIPDRIRLLGLLALLVVLILSLPGCERRDEPRGLDPDEAPTDARIEGIWGADADSLLLALNDGGTLLINGNDSLIGRNWDRYGDSLALYYHIGVAGEIRDARLRIDTLTAGMLVLSPPLPPFGGHYARR